MVSLPGQAVFKKVKPIQILLEQEIKGLRWRQLDHMQIICNHSR